MPQEMEFNGQDFDRDWGPRLDKTPWELSARLSPARDAADRRLATGGTTTPPAQRLPHLADAVPHHGARRSRPSARYHPDGAFLESGGHRRCDGWGRVGSYMDSIFLQSDGVSTKVSTVHFRSPDRVMPNGRQAGPRPTLPQPRATASGGHVWRPMALGAGSC